MRYFISRVNIKACALTNYDPIAHTLSKCGMEEVNWLSYWLYRLFDIRAPKRGHK